MNNKWSVRNYERFVHQLATGDNYLLEVFSGIKISCPHVVTGDQTCLHFGGVPCKWPSLFTGLNLCVKNALQQFGSFSQL